MPFALAIQILLAQIAMPAFQQDGEETQFIFFAQNGHKFRGFSMQRGYFSTNSTWQSSGERGRLARRVVRPRATHSLSLPAKLFGEAPKSACEAHALPRPHRTGIGNV